MNKAHRPPACLAYKVRQLWRLFATGMAFCIFGIGAVLLALTLFPLLMVVLQNRAKRRNAAQFVICRGFRLFCFILDITGVASVQIEGREKLLAAKGKLIIANHPTLLDVVIILAQMDRCQCVVKHQLFRNPFMAGVVRAAGFIRNDDNPEKLVADAARHLREGDCVMIFPEGTRTASGEKLGPLQRGVANIAITAPADLIPVIVHCNHDTLKKGTPWYRIPPSKIRYNVRVGSTISATGGIDSSDVRARRARALTAVIKHYFCDRLRHDHA
ncbi:lysophospholipid acyltransferase family protein [Thalassospira mesophila]|uniref:lysophospholipid acyltransferase family protein n=1 Tax=Thalassospira mesophila TaxID=1293891 RepID=UPI00130271D1|nr:lysophospholipid acyltransferase family protein [Thalassospira mesophila]